MLVKNSGILRVMDSERIGFVALHVWYAYIMPEAFDDASESSAAACGIDVPMSLQAHNLFQNASMSFCMQFTVSRYWSEVGRGCGV
jgi:hypothetical protein